VKVIVAPDSFKECLSAPSAASAIGEGVLSAWPDAVVDLCPMADGGEGTVGAMVSATAGRLEYVDCYDPLGSPIRAAIGLLGPAAGAGLPGLVGLIGAMDQADGAGAVAGGRTVAVVEMAAASGLDRVPLERRDPMRASTFGTGQLILAALDAGAEEIIIGVGGSATVDGGAGCAQALGVTFLDADGELCICGLAGGGLESIGRIDISDRDPRLADTRLRVACDVTNPLIGPDGAARVYGPQKGATPENVERLEAGLAHLAEVIGRDLGIDVSATRGGGAAGGLAAGLVAFAGAQLEPGARLVAETVRLGRRLKGADLCITGEGRLDATSGFGKTTCTVAAIAAELGVPTICLAGDVDDPAPRDRFAAVHSLTDATGDPSAAVDQAEDLLRTLAAEAIRTRA
jgi:glycerate kinase